MPPTASRCTRVKDSYLQYNHNILCVNEEPVFAYQYSIEKDPVYKDLKQSMIKWQGYIATRAQLKLLCAGVNNVAAKLMALVLGHVGPEDHPTSIHFARSLVSSLTNSTGFFEASRPTENYLLNSVFIPGAQPMQPTGPSISNLHNTTPLTNNLQTVRPTFACATFLTKN
ncbi:hypothetical protein BDR26DRAFT_390684 [Obelidium mucronatum]|nr:hypothetical protein BDR26DRAFT_390684 [Obelidium mucronatum]